MIEIIDVVVHAGVWLVVFSLAIPPLYRLLARTADLEDGLHALHLMAAQFETDSGSSLRDVVNRLDNTAESNRVAAEGMKINIGILKSLADQAQVELENLLRFAESSGLQAKRVAADLAIAQRAVEGVASDLEDSHDRADATEGEPGAAADAASKSDGGNGG